MLHLNSRSSPTKKIAMIIKLQTKLVVRVKSKSSHPLISLKRSAHILMTAMASMSLNLRVCQTFIKTVHTVFFDLTPVHRTTNDETCK